MTYPIGICPKCKKEFIDTPYCTAPDCLMQDIISWSIAPEGGYLTVVAENKYPLRALPLAETLNDIAFLKRHLIATARFAFKFPFVMFFFIFVPKKKLFDTVLGYLSELKGADYQGHLTIKDEHLAPSSKEIKRVLEKVNPHIFIEDAHALRTGGRWIDLTVAIYESDLAYRFRVQDIFSELDKVALLKNPRKEILRLINLDFSRELAPSMNDKVKTIRRLFKVMWLFKPFRNFFISFFTELNVEKMKPDTYDRYWVTRRFDYLYEGKTYEERMAWRLKEEEGWVEAPRSFIPNTNGVKPQIQINQPNEAFYSLSLEKATEMSQQVAQTLVKNWHDRKLKT